MPNVGSQQALDPTWTTTLDTLRAAPKFGKKDHTWRRESPIRPIRFTAPSTIDESTVQIHLGHRVSKRLLSRFLSQGFVNHDLSRACLTQSDDSIPRVVLLGRLGLFGEHATRLHEEIITITARWEKPESRAAEGLKPYGRDAEHKTIELLQKSLVESQTPMTTEVRQRLLASISQDVQDLLPYLDDRANAAKEDALKKLQERAQAEIKSITQLLHSQKKRVEDRLKDTINSNQLSLENLFSADEKAQLERESRAQKKWLEDFETQIIEEPKRIEAFYQIQTVRIEPVGLVYLWPQS